MSFNLLDMVKDQVTGQLVKQATGMLGESESGITKALGGVFPSILGSMIGKSSEQGGAAKVFDLVKSVDPGILGNIGGLLGGANDNKPNSIMNMGTGLLSTLMGNKLGGAVDLVSKLGGIKSNSAMSLFKMAAPLLTGLLSKKVVSDKMGLSDFTSLLSSQKDYVSKAMPSGMGNLLGLGSLLGSAKDLATGAAGAAVKTVGNIADGVENTGKKVADGVGKTAKNVATGVGNAANKTANVATGAAKATATTAKKTGNSLFKFLIPALLIAGLAYILSQSSMCKNTAVGDAVGSTLEKGADMTKGAVNKTADLAKDAGGAVVDGAKAVGAGISKAFGNVNDAAKAALDKITFAAGSAGQQMVDYIGGKNTNSTFRFKNLNFDTASARIAGESGAEVDNLAAILKAYPDVKVRIEGHTDSQGDDAANQTLSEARANAVKARLGAKGIAANRVSTIGHGEAKPIADNNTADGRAQNRRIEVVIVD